MTPHISIIAALGKETRAMGRKNDLIWKIDGDLPRFKKLTTGHPIIMGKKTWESLPESARPLKNRTNIVLSFEDDIFPGAITARSLQEAIKIAKEKAIQDGVSEIFIIGGGYVFKEALPFVNKLYLTLVESDEKGDVFFPEYENEFKTVVSEEKHPEHSPRFTYLELKR